MRSLGSARCCNVYSLTARVRLIRIMTMGVAVGMVGVVVVVRRWGLRRRMQPAG